MKDAPPRRFKVGDIVLLRSGGPAMTVDDAGGPQVMNGFNVYHVLWFVNGEVKRDSFLEPELI